MAHIKISDLVPVAADLIGLEVEEVAGVLLVHLNSDPPANPGLYPYKNGTNVNYHSFCQAIHDKPPYGVKNDEVKTALMEAWGWLQSAGLLVPEDNWLFLSRRARRLTKRDEFRNYQNGRLLPKEQIHPLIAVRVYPAFLRGEYDTAVFQAFREVEIAIREAARIPEGTKGADVIRDAFRVANDKGPAGPLTDQSIPRGEQESMLLLFSGAFGFYRFKHSGLKRYFETGKAKGIPADMAKRIQARLNVLNRAGELRDLNLPGFGFHSLKGDRKGEYALTVTANYRLTFRFENNDVLDLNLEDYHLKERQ